jgi:prevent-host-death family protein
MLTVGIKELKAKLSSYVDRAARGEMIVITEHGREIALLVPISNERLAVKSLIKNNRAKWSGGKPSGLRGIRIEGRPLSETVLEERE